MKPFTKKDKKKILSIKSGKHDTRKYPPKMLPDHIIDTKDSKRFTPKMNIF